MTVTTPTRRFPAGLLVPVRGPWVGPFRGRDVVGTGEDRTGVSRGHTRVVGTGYRL